MKSQKYIAVLFFVLFFAVPAVASAATFYVATTGSDANPGSSSQPFRTIGRCANVAQAGDTCLVQAGTYSERVSTFRSGTASNRIVIKGESATKPTVSGFSINNAYITVEGFRISNTGTAVTVSGAHYCEILNNEFLGAEEGIDMSGSPTGCRIRGNWFHGSTVVSVLITLRGSGHIVENNEFGPLVMHEDIFRPFGDNNTIRNNYFRNITSGATGGHMDIFQIYGGASDRRVINLLFEQNFVNGWPGQAWMVDCTPDSRLITVRNNVFYNVNSAGQSYCPENLIYSNTFAHSGFGNGRAVMIRNGADERAPSRGLGTNSKIKNNIFYYTSYSGDAYAGGYDVDNGAQSTFEGRNNIAFPTTASGLIPGTNNINGTDPQFANASNAVGADGRPFTADDGLIPPTNSPVCGAGEAGTDIGAYKCGGAGLPAAGPPISDGGGGGDDDGGGGDTGGGGGGESSGANPPTVSITSPRIGQNFPLATAAVTVNVSAVDVDGVARVDFYDGNVLRGRDDDASCENGGTSCSYPSSFSFTFGDLTAGAGGAAVSHTLRAVAYDNQGASASAAVIVTVGTLIGSGYKSATGGSSDVPPCTPPTVDLKNDLKNVSTPCPVLSVSVSPIAANAPVTIGLTVQPRQYVWNTIFVSDISNPRIKKWIPKTIPSCGADGWCTSSDGIEHTLTLNASALSSLGGAGTHYVASWDWTWNGTCWLGPGTTSCDTPGKWRVQKFLVGAVSGSEEPPPSSSVFALSVTKQGGGVGTVTATGIACGTDCSESYSSGTQVTLTAASSGSLFRFSGWGGACSGSGTTCTLTMNGAKTVTATFNTQSVSGTSSLKMAVPAYFSPNTRGATWTLWSHMISQSPPVTGFVIMNPANGVGLLGRDDYRTAVKNVQEAGVKVIGYVETDYGRRDAALIKAEIDKYKSWYGVDGIFFDEVPTTATYVPYYRDLYTHVRSQTEMLVVLNPGVVPDEGYMEVSDVIFTFEDYYSKYASAWFPSWTSDYSADRFGLLLHDTFSESDMRTAFSLARQRNVGYIYVTNDRYDSNPWDSLPSYWTQELDEMRK